MLLIPLYLLLFQHFGDDSAEFNDFYNQAVYFIIGLEILLAAYIIWLLKNPDAFEITLSAEEFSVYHPLSKQWTFKVKPQQIAEVKHCYGIDSGATIQVILKDGSKYYLCQNYNYSRQKLYQYLGQINPDITLPDNPYYFKKS